MASLSPWIAESIRRRKLEQDQARALAAVVNELLPGQVFDWTTEQKVAHLKWQRRTKRHDQRKSQVRRARLAEAPITGRVDRDEIIRRDGSTCYLCGKVCEPAEIHLDHVVPLSKGGAHGPENVRVACAPCNIAKGASLLPAS